MKNIMITGEKQVGKSTVIERILKDYEGKVGGFLTCKQQLDNYRGIYIFDINDEEKIPTPENHVAVCGDTRVLEIYTQPFDTIGVKALDCKDCDLMVMDELGAIERKAHLFKQKVVEVLDADVAVLGVLQNRNNDFLNGIKNRKDTLVITLTKETRQSVYQKINTHLRNIKMKRKY